MGWLARRFGFVRLRDYGLALTDDDVVVPVSGAKNLLPSAPAPKQPLQTAQLTSSPPVLEPTPIPATTKAPELAVPAKTMMLTSAPPPLLSDTTWLAEGTPPPPPPSRGPDASQELRPPSVTDVFGIKADTLAGPELEGIADTVKFSRVEPHGTVRSSAPPPPKVGNVGPDDSTIKRRRVPAAELVDTTERHALANLNLRRDEVQLDDASDVISDRTDVDAAHPLMDTLPTPTVVLD